MSGFTDVTLGRTYESLQQHLAVICRVIMQNTAVQVAPIVTGKEVELMITDATGAQVTTALQQRVPDYPMKVGREPAIVQKRDDFIAYVNAHLTAMGFSTVHFSSISLLVESVRDGSMQDVLFWE